MITIFKLFENTNEPQVGDYVICHEIPIVSSNSDKLENFINNNIGQIDEKIKNNLFSITYLNIPNDIRNRFYYNYNKYNRRMRDFEIVYFSKNKIDVEKYLKAKKYNII
jgi:hypothetical protein